jgi:hypothetical protein
MVIWVIKYSRFIRFIEAKRVGRGLYARLVQTSVVYL